MPVSLGNASTVNFYLDFNDELGLLRVTVAGAEGMFSKGNVGARWHWAQGNILDLSQSSFDTPGMVVANATTNWVGTGIFSTQTHVLDDGWMEVLTGQDWFWLEVPSGIALCPGTPPSLAVPRSNTGLPSGVGQLTAKDHIMRWDRLYCSNLRMTKAGPGTYWTNKTPAGGASR
jgi:hypothetical protein